MKRTLGWSLIVCLALLLTAASAAAAEPTAPPAPPLVLLALQQAQLSASDGAANGLFGWRVDFSGNTALVGAPGADVGGRIGQGAAYVFVRSGGTWSEQQKLTAADGAAGDEFGHDVALDGDTAVVGAAGDDVGSTIDQGSAYVFVRSGGIWSEQAKLTAADGAANDWFGQSVALDGDSAVVGAYGDDVGGNRDQGSATIFVRSGSAWSQLATLTAADAAAADAFGRDVALDGDSALVAAPEDDVGGNRDQGSATIFVRSGSVWSQQAKLTAADGGDGDWFGWAAVALDGDVALVGAYRADVGGSTNRGAAYVFARSGSTWSEQQKLTAADGAANDEFGHAVALSGDRALVGAPGDDVGSNRDQGSAFLYVRSGSTWSEQQKLPAADGAANDFFSEGAVALSGDTALVGAPSNDVGSNRRQGSAYVFALDISAPVTTAGLSPLANAAGWNSAAVTVTLSATDDVSGVEDTWYRLGDAGVYGIYDAATRPVVSSEGVTNVWFYSRDVAGNVETAKSLPVRIDTQTPTTRARPASVKVGRRVLLKYTVADALPGCGEAAVTLEVTKGGRTVRTVPLGDKPANAALAYSFKARLAKGVYAWRVRATDLAGNPASRVTAAKLTVK
jgi:hypothetical protein